MRALFTFAGGAGHFVPLLPFARAWQAIGHEIVVGSQPALRQRVEQEGFRAFDTGGNTVSQDSKRMPLRSFDLQHEYRVVRESYAGHLAQTRAAALLTLCTQWKPDVLVCDEMDFGAMVAAERLSLPYATVLVIATGAFTPPSLIVEALNQLRAEHGLTADPDLQMLSRYLVLSPFPPSLRDPSFPLPPTAHGFRSSLPSLDAPSPHKGMTRLPHASTIYITLGTIFNVESGDLFSRLLLGLRTLPINLVVTVGPQIDPQELGPQPTNVHLERYLRQESLLPHCDLVISHGGSGTVLGALTQGLPQVLVPLGADQLLNARRCEELHVAQALEAVQSTPQQIQETVTAVLADQSYRQAAKLIQTEIVALPDQKHAVTLLERLARQKTPVLGRQIV